ncbi:protein obstructor-E isoform X1 [Bactrocera dorsalis]|uniref:Protein obstructor-E isoform X1 n=1 Tax=Bactrocera dorsalis TaxID=27457 RepID=A0ABM3JE44_BACDO|nr:protein obstructor-E isoform X1 [Bactrocera dorsalis]
MFKILLSATLCVAMFGSFAHAQCQQPNGTQAVSGSCDAYIECKNGVAEEKLCPDGLLYNEKSSGYPCGYPIDVECSQGQARTQPAQPTDDCPHQFGYYSMGDARNCGKFKNCASGRGFVFDCPDGLAWNKETYKCDWPDQVPDCDAEAFLGFKCPPPKPSPRGQFIGEPEQEYEFYPSSENCQVYFICIEGRPRRIACDEASAFNPETQTCDDIDNVPTCSADVKQRGQEIKNARLSAQSAASAKRRY